MSAPPAYVRCNAPAVVGKSALAVEPATLMRPAASTAIAAIASSADPPRYVEKTIRLPSGVSSVTKPSPCCRPA